MPAVAVAQQGDQEQRPAAPLPGDAAQRGRACSRRGARRATGPTRAASAVAARRCAASAPPASTSTSAPAACRWPSPTRSRSARSPATPAGRAATWSPTSLARPPRSGGPARRLQDGDLELGRRLFTDSCSGCHQIAGKGGIAPGLVAPPLVDATPTQIGEAIRVGPYLMPNFFDRAGSTPRRRLHRALRAASPGTRRTTRAAGRSATSGRSRRAGRLADRRRRRC